MAKRKRPDPCRRDDPYFNDIPYDIIFDKRGRVIGEVYVTTESLLPRREREWSAPMKRENKKRLPTKCRSANTAERE